MPADDDLALLSTETEVEPHRVRPLAVVGALALAAAVATLVVVVLAHYFTAEQPAATGPRTGLTLTEIENLTGLDLPDGTEVTTSSYEQTAEADELVAELQLPDGTGDPFAGTAYYEVEGGNERWPGGVAYEANGDFGLLSADGVWRDGFVGVHVRHEK